MKVFNTYFSDDENNNYNNSIIDSSVTFLHAASAICQSLNPFSNISLIKFNMSNICNILNYNIALFAPSKFDNMIMSYLQHLHWVAIEMLWTVLAFSLPISNYIEFQNHNDDADDLEKSLLPISECINTMFAMFALGSCVFTGNIFNVQFLAAALTCFFTAISTHRYKIDQ